MSTFKLNIASPDGKAFSGDAVMLLLRGIEGDLAIMANHTPFVTGVKKCRVRVDLPDETTLCGNVDGGILTVKNNEVTLLSGSFVKE